MLPTRRGSSRRSRGAAIALLRQFTRRARSPSVVQRRRHAQAFTYRVLIGLAFVTAALVAGAWWAASEDARVRIAVVPFDNETGMEEFDRIARGVADATVARLSTPERVAAFSVIGNAAALQQPRAFRDLKRIGTEPAPTTSCSRR